MEKPDMTSNACHFFDGAHDDEVLLVIWPEAHDPMDAMIKTLTRGKGTHAAFRRGLANRHRIIENFYPHVRERDWKPGERERVEFYRIVGSTPDDWWALERWFDDELAHPVPYSVLDLFRYAVNLPPRPGAACFCSMWCLRAIRLNLSPCKQPLARLEYVDYASPRDLRLSPLLIRKRRAS